MKRKSVLAVLIVLFLFSGTAFAEELFPSGKMTISTTVISAGLGVSWGDGFLNYEGKDYTFTLKGLNIIDVGIASVKAVGAVYNLKDISDFPGSYTATDASVALIKGKTGLVLKNKKGVIIDLQAVEQGVKLTLGAKDITIKMK